MHRIEDIEEPAVQIFVTDIAALSVIHRDRYESEKCTELKRKEREHLKLFSVNQGLQDRRCQNEENGSFSEIPLIVVEEDDCPRRYQIRPIAKMREGDQTAEQNNAHRR